MGYNGGGADSFGGGGGGVGDRKCRALVPRPAVAAAVNHPPCLGRIHGADLLSLNHHLAAMTEQSKREFNTQQVVVSSRWNPTPEQLQTLEELYRQGTRTPSAEQIQHITAQLRRYGKIEGKNVFYWFQNHKARERQKRRRQHETSSDDPIQQNMESLQRKESGENGTGLELEEANNWTSPPTNCSILSERTVSMQRAPIATIADCRSDGWVQFDDSYIQQKKNLEEERNATWHMMQSFCPSSSSSSPSNLISPSDVSTSPTDVIRTKIHTDPINVHHNHDSTFLTPYLDTLNHDMADMEGGNGVCIGESQTLELFPLRSDESENAREKESVSATNASALIPQKFFEFLPLKN